MLPSCFATKGAIPSQITNLVVCFGIIMGLMMVPSASAQDSNPFNVWVLQGNRDDGSTKVKINHAGLIAVLAAGEPLTLSFILPDDVFECTVAPSQLMAPELQSKYSEIKVFVGQCSQDGSAIVVVNENEANSMSATLYNSLGEVLYVDHNIEDDNPETYTIVDKQNVVLPEGSSWSDSVIHGRRLGQNLLNPLNRSLQNKELEGKIYRTAIGTTLEFSQLYGDTRASVLLQVVKAMARVNGIYLREVGVMFQLIGNTDDLFCVAGDNNCSYLNSGNSGVLHSQATDYITNVRGISIASFDLGHIFGTSRDGLATLGSVCDDTVKAQGVTGLDIDRDEDIFFVDYLSHEIGHQMGAEHVFRDCEKGDPNIATESAVEPGSGTTIMSYAGICIEGKNIQPSADPYFNSWSINQIRGVVENTACGGTFTIPGTLPTVSTKPTCTVPKGNYVQLDGQVSNPGGPVWYAWDQVDPGAADYNNVDIPRFVPHFPTQRSSKRFLPNMYLISFGLGNQLEEIPPKATVPGDDVMGFRFVARTRFDANELASNFDASLSGTFNFQDMTLTYSQSVAPLAITSVGTFEATRQVSVTWTGGIGLTDQVEFLIAINTMQQVDAFEYERDVVDLAWISMGTFPNNGAATLQVPALNPGSRPVNVMIRSRDSNDPAPNDCYFFDIRTVEVKQPSGFLCFSSETTVDVLEQGPTRMDALKIGDSVLTAEGKFSKVYGFGHKDQSAKTMYRQIFTANMQKDHPLEISAEHLIYTQDPSKNTPMLVAAGDLRVGDMILTASGNPSTVLWIREVERQGAYAPLTVSGNLLVNGVLASSYVSRSWLKDHVSGLTLHKFQHGAMLPVQLFCSFVGCQEESYDESTGFSAWVQFWYEIEQWMLTLPLAGRACFLSLLLVPATLIAFLGNSLVQPLSSLITHAVAVILGCVIWKRQTRKKTAPGNESAAKSS